MGGGADCNNKNLTLTYFSLSILTRSVFKKQSCQYYRCSFFLEDMIFFICSVASDLDLHYLRTPVFPKLRFKMIFVHPAFSIMKPNTIPPVHVVHIVSSGASLLEHHIGPDQIVERNWTVKNMFNDPNRKNRLTMADIWAPSWQNQPNDMCAQRRQISQGIRQSDQSSLCAQWVATNQSFLRANSKDWADAYADLCFGWAHMPISYFFPCDCSFYS